MHQIFIVTLLKEKGETGVQTHFNLFNRFCISYGVDSKIITPYHSNKFFVYLFFSFRFIIHFFNKSLSVWWYREIHAFFLKLALRKVLKENPGAIIYAQCPVSAGVSLTLPGSHKTYLVVHFNESQANEWQGKGFIAKDSWIYNDIIKFERETLQKVAGLIFVSDFMRSKILSQYPSASEVSSLLSPNFIPSYSSSKLDCHDYDLLVIGSLEPRKNQKYAIDMVAASVELGSPFTLTVVGDGPDRHMLETYTKLKKVEHLVRFVGFRSDAKSFFANHAACLHCAIMENMPFVLIESLSAGKPIFAPDVGGITEILFDGINGSIIPLDDPVCAAKIVNKALKNHALMEYYSSQAIEIFNTTFHEDVVASKIIKFLLGRN